MSTDKKVTRQRAQIVADNNVTDAKFTNTGDRSPMKANAENDSLVAEVKSLKASLNKVCAENSTLTQDRTELRAECIALEANASKASAEQAGLLTEVHALKVVLKSTTKERNYLHATLYPHGDGEGTSTGQDDSLRGRLEIMKDDRDALLKENEDMDVSIEDFRRVHTKQTIRIVQLEHDLIEAQGVVIRNSEAALLSTRLDEAHEKLDAMNARLRCVIAAQLCLLEACDPAPCVSEPCVGTPSDR